MSQHNCLCLFPYLHCSLLPSEMPLRYPAEKGSSYRWERLHPTLIITLHHSRLSLVAQRRGHLVQNMRRFLLMILSSHCHLSLVLANSHKMLEKASLQSHSLICVTNVTFLGLQLLSVRLFLFSALIFTHFLNIHFRYIENARHKGVKDSN